MMAVDATNTIGGPAENFSVCGSAARLSRNHTATIAPCVPITAHWGQTKRRPAPIITRWRPG
jgi:hypothetical protein